jgi:hypothetical protein
MGRNAPIKRFNATETGQTMDLFSSKEGRLPVILELLKTPWIMRASELVHDDAAQSAKRREETIAVAWDARCRCPASFTRGGRIYRIDLIVQIWAVERYWWSPRKRISRRYWRVIARGGTYDLAYDRLGSRWLLLGVQD